MPVILFPFKSIRYGVIADGKLRKCKAVDTPHFLHKALAKQLLTQLQRFAWQNLICNVLHH